VQGAKATQLNAACATTKPSAVALGHALFVTLNVPWALCFGFYLILHSTYGPDRKKISVAAADEAIERFNIDDVFDASFVEGLGSGGGGNGLDLDEVEMVGVTAVEHAYELELENGGNGDDFAHAIGGRRRSRAGLVACEEVEVNEGEGTGLLTEGSMPLPSDRNAFTHSPR
jgi:hypothetical protein